jgi:hypothetical protein
MPPYPEGGKVIFNHLVVKFFVVQVCRARVSWEGGRSGNMNNQYR